MEDLPPDSFSSSNLPGQPQFLKPGSNREEILNRFERWLDDVLTEELPPEGISKELLEEIQPGTQGDQSCADYQKNDLYSMWSSITALTQEVKLQGRVFKELHSRLERVSGLDQSIDAVLQANRSALAEAKQIAEQALAERKVRERELIREAEHRGKQSIIGGLLNTRDGMVRGLASVRDARRALEQAEEQSSRSGWLRFLSPRNQKNSAMNIISALEKGYEISLARLNEEALHLGVQEIQSEGQLFDARTMSVVDVQAAPNVPDGTVLEVYRTGYMLDGIVIHPSQVKVARNK